jgi:tRNA (guanine37-N1)-methyltransferase
VPDVLISGNHRLIEEWRMKESLKRTLKRRPDLLDDADLTDQQKKWLDELSKLND